VKLPIVLKVYRGEKLEAVQQFEGLQVVIGRGGDVGLALQDDSVSSLHTMIEDRDGQYFISDLGSKTGTFKNGNRILEESLESGDELRIGEFRILFFIGVPGAPAAQPKREAKVSAVSPESKPIKFEFIAPLITSPVDEDTPPPVVPHVSSPVSSKVSTPKSASSSSPAPNTTKISNPSVGPSGPRAPVSSPLEKPSPPKPLGFSSNSFPSAVAVKAKPFGSVSVSNKHKGKTFAPPSSYKDAKDIIKPGKGTVVEVLVLWKERVLSTHHFFDKGSVTIGGSEKADVFVPILTGDTQFQLLKIAGTITVCLSTEMTGELIRENESISIAELARQQKLRNMGAVFELDLRQGEMIRLNLADTVSLMVRYKGETPKPIVAPLLDFSASEVTGVILAGVISAIFALYMSLYASSNLLEDEANLEEPIRKAIVTFNPPKPIEEPKVEPVKEEPKKIVEVKEKAKSIKSDVKSAEMKHPKKQDASKESVAAPGDPGKAGEVAPKPDPNKTKKMTSARSGGATKTAPKEGANMKSDKPDPSKVGLLGVFSNKGTQSKLDKAYSGSGELQGMAEKANGMAGSNEDRAGDTMGTKLKDTGAGGKGSSTIGIAGLGTNGRGTGTTGYGTGGLGSKGSVKIDVGGQDADFPGSIDKEAIRRVILAHKAEIRFCYDKELQKHPDLAGKVVIGWNIGEDGRVSKAGVASDSLGNSEVANCIVNKLKTWGFPPAPPDVEAHVSYPFVFSSN
jgi:hypothetical protein